MEILAIVMLSLFIAIIAFAVVMYVIVRKNSVNRSFERRIDEDFDDDMDDEEDELPNIVLPLNWERNYSSSIENESVSLKEEVLKETNDNLEKNSEIVLPVVNVSNEKIEEVVNILIDKKNYIFLANDNQVSKNEHIKLIIDNKIYFGTVTKANYKRDINNMKVKPRKLIIIKNKTKKVPVIEQNEELEFIPKRKKKD